MSKSLYKYCVLDENENIISNLKTNQIYFQTPIVFNDPYEFIFKFDLNNSELTEFLKLIYQEKYNHFDGMSKEDILAHTRDCYFTNLRKNMGVCCFSENENNDLMWAHYAGNHTGICIEYDRDCNPFKLVRPVNYVDNVMTIRIDNTEYFRKNIPIIFKDVLLRKSAIWRYENEWRLIFRANDIIKYDPKAIQSITFGFYCKDENKQRIFKETVHLNIKYFEVVRSKDAYHIEKLPVMP